MTIQTFQQFQVQQPSLALSSKTTKSVSSSIREIIPANINSKPTKLPDDFKPRDIDILCGRGRGVWDHPGNRRYKMLIEDNVEEFIMARNRIDKGVVIACMVDRIRQQGSLFARKEPKDNCWYDIGEHQAREKTSHAMRDYISKSIGTIGKCKDMSTINDIKAKLQKHKDKQRRDQQSNILGGLERFLQKQQKDTTISSVSNMSCLLPVQTKKPLLPRKISTDTMPTQDTNQQQQQELTTTTTTTFNVSLSDSLLLVDGSNTHWILDEGIMNEKQAVAATSPIISKDCQVEETTAIILEEDNNTFQWSELFPTETYEMGYLLQAAYSIPKPFDRVITE